MNESIRQKIDPSSPIVRVENLSVSLGEHRILNDISFDLRGGQVLTILGPNAAGKTTLLRTLAGVIASDSGEIQLCSDETVGWVGHQSFLYDELTVRENLLFWARMQNVINPVGRVEELIENYNMSLIADTRIDMLSFGQVRRVSICRAILADPKLLLLDEAFTGLDQAGVDWLACLINYYRELSAAVILVSHHIAMGLNVATDLMVLNQGRTILYDKLDHLDRGLLVQDYLRYANDRVAAMQAGGR
jgi:heme ABC exporter ATP-binding subunit CcmA